MNSEEDLKIMVNKFIQEINSMGLERSAGFKNLVSIREYSKKTRDEVRKFEEKINNLEKLILNQDLIIKQQSKSISILQGRLYLIK